MSFRRIAIGSLVGAACIGGALACGPLFSWKPLELLDDRGSTVGSSISLSFDEEASKLVPGRRDGMEVVEQHEEGTEALKVERDEAGRGAWAALIPQSANQRDLLSRLDKARSAPDGQAAMEAGAGLPTAVLEYIAGAIEFRSDDLDAALKRFEAIERLPPDQQRIRTVAAAYMRGRVHQRTGDFAAAREAFQATRVRARHNPDPMGLGVASLGEEARVDLVEAGMLPNPWGPKSMPELPHDEEKEAQLVVKAVNLYAEQAARGSRVALESLWEVAGLLLDKTGTLQRTVADPAVRRLVVAYAIARTEVSVWDENPPRTISERAADAILTLPTLPVGDDLDRLGAMAYKLGRYDVAEKFTAATDRPLGLWIRAKLGLRRGDRDAAVRDWKAAIAGPDTGLNEKAKTQMRGELAVIQLGQGRYVASLRMLFPVADTYWGDVAYIAERVLTVEELKAFVDSLPRADMSEAVPGGRDRHSVENMRVMLARRLVREGRLYEAIAYFPSSILESPTDSRAGSRAIAADARGYLLAVQTARHTWPWQNVLRAEALFTGALLVRKRGMELMGTEGAPDLAMVEGSYPDDGKSDPPKESNLIGPDEAARVAASAPKPDVRFHYRVIATDQALAAADLLPQRSQAYAATLCWATRFAFDSRDEARAAQIYRRYVKTGAHQPWAAKRFGRVCPQPDFEAARDFWPRRITAWPGEIAAALWRKLGGGRQSNVVQ